MQSVAEALVFTEKAGIGPESMAEVIAAIFPGSPHGIYVGRMLSGEYHRTTEVRAPLYPPFLFYLCGDLR